MNDIEFERLLSAAPKEGFMIQQPCLRTLIFDHFEEFFGAETANELTKVYTDELSKMFVNRKM